MAVAASSFTGVDFTRLPTPAAVDALDYETFLAARLARFQALCAAAGIDYSSLSESDSVIKLQEANAYRELVMRADINAAILSNLAPYATGADQDALFSLLDAERYVITSADAANGVAEVDEDDITFRRRAVLSTQSYSVAGPSGAYLAWAKAADSAVVDVSVDSPSPGTVVVTVFADTPDGTPTDATIAAVTAKLSDKTIRPLTDHVVVQKAQILPYAIVAAPRFFAGASRPVALEAAQNAVDDYVAACRALGWPITRDGITGAIMQPGVAEANLSSPAADIMPTMAQAGYCTGIAITDGGLFA